LETGELGDPAINLSPLFTMPQDLMQSLGAILVSIALFTTTILTSAVYATNQ
jgi:hypothetical protein